MKTSWGFALAVLFDTVNKDFSSAAAMRRAHEFFARLSHRVILQMRKINCLAAELQKNVA
jgi:hypothetical protein